MKYITVISLVLGIFLSFSSDLSAMVASTQTKVTSLFELGTNDLIELDRKALQQKIGRKLKLKERIALRFVKKKLKKHSEWSGMEAKEATVTDGFAIAGFVIGLLSLFIAGIIFGLMATIFSVLALDRIRRNPNLGGRGLAIAGFILGLVGLFGAIVVLASLR